jgi:hypothetical protein
MNMNPQTETQNETNTRGLIVAETTTFPGLAAVVGSLGDTAQAARDLGEDAVHTVALVGTYTVDGHAVPVDVSGTVEVGASYTRAQTTAFPLAEALHMAFGVMGAHAPQMLDAVLAGMRASRDGTDATAALRAAGFNLSEAASERATAEMRTLSTESRRNVRASVRFNAD